jgi:hypothetical protein
MGFLSNAVAQMIASMEPAERSEAITEVTGQALALMSAEERLELTRRLYVMLLESLEPAGRQSLAARLSEALAAPAAEG